MRNDYTDITVVLDKSGSMEGIKPKTIEGFNKFLKEQRDICTEQDDVALELGESGAIGQATITLVQFSNESEITYEAQNIINAPNLTNVTYHTGGGTALLDTIAMAIERTGKRLSKMKEEDRPGKVVFVIITDGEENSSVRFERKQIFDMINHQSVNYKWGFVFLGANQDAIQTGASLGIGAGSSLTYSHSNIGAQHAFASVSKGMTSYRTSSAPTMDCYFSQEDRDTQSMIDNKLNNLNTNFSGKI